MITQEHVDALKVMFPHGFVVMALSPSQDPGAETYTLVSANLPGDKRPIEAEKFLKQWADLGFPSVQVDVKI